MAFGASQGSGRFPHHPHPQTPLLQGFSLPSSQSPALLLPCRIHLSWTTLPTGSSSEHSPVSRYPTAVKWTQSFGPLSHIGPLEAQSFLLYATDSSWFFSRSWMLTETPAPLLGSVSLDSCPAAFCLYTQASSAN